MRTNSFASHAEGLTGLPLHRADDRQAALHTDGKVWIAGDIGPIPTNGEISDVDILAQFEAMLDALLDAGAEIILFETFADFEYILPAIHYVKKQATEKHLLQSPIIMVSFCLNKFGCTKAGISASNLVKTAADSGIYSSQFRLSGFHSGQKSFRLMNYFKQLNIEYFADEY